MSTRGFEFAPSMHVVVAGEPTAETLAMANTVRNSGLSCVCLPNCRSFVEHARYLKPDLILLDEGHAIEFLRDIGAHEDIRVVPRIHLVSPDADSRAQAFAAGALDCIVKPIPGRGTAGAAKRAPRIAGVAKAARKHAVHHNARQY